MLFLGGWGSGMVGGPGLPLTQAWALRHIRPDLPPRRSSLWRHHHPARGVGGGEKVRDLSGASEAHLELGASLGKPCAIPPAEDWTR